MEGTMQASEQAFARRGDSCGQPCGAPCDEASPAGEIDGRPSITRANDGRDGDDRDGIEHWVESDPALAPTGPSALLVEPSVLEPEEVTALLADLGDLLAAAGSDLANHALVGAP